MSSNAPPWAPGHAHLTAAWPGVPFAFRRSPEDFVVHELPGAPAEGEGTHLWVTFEKRGIPTDELARRFARALGREEREVGYAGRKDAVAVARQRLSIEHADPERIASLRIGGARVLAVERAGRKLRRGDLAGNRFELVLRGVAAADRPRLEEMLEVLVARGLPNGFGAQRFGRTGRGYELGRLLVEGDAEAYLRALVSPRHAPPGPARESLAAALAAGSRAGGSRAGGGRAGELARGLDPVLAAAARQLARRPDDLVSVVSAVPRTVQRFQISALQSRVFNRVLGARLAAGAIERPEVGDLAHDHALPPGARNGFRVDAATDLDALGARAARLEVSPTGPLPGRRGLAAAGRPAAWERAALAAEGVELDALLALEPALAPRGDRRPLRVPVRDLALADAPACGSDALRLVFVLPPGSYATALLEELRKDHG